MEIGKKYISTVKQELNRNDCTFIFLGFENEANTQGYFIKDDQELFDFLGEPYSEEAVRKMDFFNTNKGSRTIYTFDCRDESEWLDADAIYNRTIELQDEIEALRKLNVSLNKTAFYECDCTNGSVYQEFISEFKKRCSQKGLSLRGYTFHGEQGTNELSVCHNCNETEDFNGFSQSSVFFELNRDPKYKRIHASYCQSTNQPLLTD